MPRYKYLLLTIALLTFSGCSTTYIKPKAFDIRFAKQCKPPNIHPNKDGSLNKEEHKKLLEWAVCTNHANEFYVYELKQIKKAQDDNSQIE